MLEEIKLRGRKIRVDENGLYSLNDIHLAAGFTKNQLPTDWMRLPSFSGDYEAVARRITGKSRNWTKIEMKSICYTNRGSTGGSWAHENLALSYAAYLSRDLATEIRDVFLRYRKGDETLIPEIQENKARQDNSLREQHRVIGKEIRKGYTATLKDHGVEKPLDYANCTNEVYKPILGGTASQIKISRGLNKKANLRDHMTASELAFAMAAEALASERIEHANSAGYLQCKDETKLAAGAIGSAIQSDRKNRQQRLI